MRIGAVVVVALLIACSHTAPGGSEPAGPPNTPVAYLSQSGARLEVVFPAMAPADAGCMHIDSSGPGVRRMYEWYAARDFPDSERDRSHFMGIYVVFQLPDSVPLTTERLDSALAGLTIGVEEIAGEPPTRVAYLQPRSSRAYRAGGRVHVVVADRDVVHRFLGPTSDSIDVGWCRRDGPPSHVRVPVVRGP
ncbi:MAG: hypothetical protein P8099_06195 [Gemmatimonadota bacterium]